MTTVSVQPAQVPQRLLKAFGVLLAFAAIGPALGGLFVFCCVYPVMLLTGLDPAATTPDAGPKSEPLAIFEVMGFFVALAYAFGGPQAVLTGLWAAITTARDKALSGRATVIAAIIATLLWIALLYSPLQLLGPADAGSVDKIASAVRISLALIPVAIVCALACRWLAGKLGLLRVT